MTERNVLYLDIARKCAARGENARAIITVINALSTNPRYIDAEPAFIELLAGIYDVKTDRAFDDEINALEARRPAFGDKLRDALLACNKTEEAARRIASFEEYCISQMKYAQTASEQMPPQAALRAFDDVYAHRCSHLRASGAYPSIPHSHFSPDDALPQAYPPLSEMPIGYSPDLMAHPTEHQPSTRFWSDSATDGLRATSDAWHNRVPFPSLDRPRSASSDRRLSQTRPSFRNAPDDLPTPNSFRPYDVSSLNLSNNSCRRSTGNSIRSTAKFENILGGGGDGDNASRRFERIDLSRQTHIAAPDYADTAAERIIIDFDNTIKETPKSEFFTASKTKFRPYDEDVAAMRESSALQNAVRRDRQAATTAERIAEKTHALSDTPSVEPFANKNALRFFVSPRQILACATICLLGVFSLVSYESAKPEIEKRAVDDISAAYIEADTPDVRHNAASAPPLIDPLWIQSYDEFLATWHANYFDADIVEIPTPDSDDPAPRHAAFIDRSIADGNLERAVRHFKTIDANAWRQHAYFKSWSGISIDIALGNADDAIIGCRRLLRSPLAPFARTRLAILALENSNDDARDAFMQSMNERADTIPKTNIARCLQAVFDRGATDAPQTPNILPPYDAYCAAGRVFSALKRGSLLAKRSDFDDLELLEKRYAKANAFRNDSNAYALEALIRAEIFRKNPERAARLFNDIDLPSDHPQRRAIQNAILKEAFALGNWDILHAIDPKFPTKTLMFDAMRFIDSKRLQIPFSPTPATHIFSYETHANASNARFANAIHGRPPADDVDHRIDLIYRDAYNGMLDTALQNVRNPEILKNHPYEALLLQSVILSAQGKNEEAAQLLSGDFKDPYLSLPLIILNNCYRARAGLPLAPQGFVIPFVSSADPFVESARCEILWRKNMPQAKSCIANLNRERPRMKNAWIMDRLERPDAVPSGAAAAWKYADAAALAFPDFALAYARTLAREAQYRSAAVQYVRAITDSTTYSTNRLIDIVREFEATFNANARRLTAARTLDAALAKADTATLHPTVSGVMHLSAARLYQPKSANAMVKSHLAKANEFLGDHPDVLREFIRYYDAKNKPEHAAKYRARLQKQSP